MAHPEAGDSRPTLRTIARVAGVSAMTVSRVLRNQAKISAATRARVEKIARELNYRADPHVAKLMHHLRVRRKPAFQSSLCALTTWLPDKQPFYTDEILRGARLRADARGYGFSVRHVPVSPEPQSGLQRILHNRGVEGLLLLPMATPTVLTELMDWREFSVLATTMSVLAPGFHRVVPNHFDNTQRLCRELAQLGYRRIGLAMNHDHMRRVNHVFNAGVMWHNIYQGDALVPPLLYSGDLPPAGALQAWFKRERPDVIVAHAAHQCRAFAHTLGLKIPGPIGFAGTNTLVSSPIAGIEERPDEIGAAAVDLLAGMIQRAEKGVPAVPTSTLIQGQWIPGRSCPPRSAPPPPAGNPKPIRPLIYSHR
jgi:DNA-binding LacI/PurR family transcriptional regulator